MKQTNICRLSGDIIMFVYNENDMSREETSGESPIKVYKPAVNLVQ